MSEIVVGLYARVSSEQQAEAKTIASQMAALEARVLADGLIAPPERQFIDEGYSGASLVRPGLERLRDLAAGGGLDRLYVHSPDRLARKYAYQVLLLDELTRAGVAVIFLNRALGETPEDDLLLQVQGMVAEYERAKILERSRRGKRHAAHQGSVNVLSGAPFGYRYITKAEGGGQARYEIVFDEARIVRQVFRWVGEERLSIGEVVRRLNTAGERTRSGKTVWDRSTVATMLHNPAYQGQAAFGKTRTGPFTPQRLREQRGRPAQPRHAVTTSDVPTDEWLAVPVAPLVDADLFTAVHEQLGENQRHARAHQTGARYLLQGLVVCAECGYAFYGKVISPSAAKGKPRDYAYYRCLGTDAYRFGGERLCHNPQVRTDRVDAAVWQEVRSLQEEPERLATEYRRRLAEPVPEVGELSTLEAQVSKLRQGIARLIDSYTEGLIDKGEFEPRVSRLRQRLVHLEEQARELADVLRVDEELRLIVGQVESFAGQVRQGLEDADWLARRELIRMLVKRVEIGPGEVKVVFRVPPRPFVMTPETGVLPVCRRGHITCYKLQKEGVMDEFDVFGVTMNEYTVLCCNHQIPALYHTYCRDARLVDEMGLSTSDGRLAFLAIALRNESPFLVVAQRYKPWGFGFNPGALLIAETNLLFIGAGTRLLASELRKPARLWEDQADLGFWHWQRHGRFVLMSAEVELAAWDTDGQKKWTTFVEPPWSYRVAGGLVQLDVMGNEETFPIETGLL